MRAKKKFIKNICFDLVSDPPGLPIISKVSPNVLEFNVTWNATIDNGGSDILDFMITLLDASSSEVLQQNRTKETSFTLQNLQQNKTYICILQARNIVGYGQSANATVTTLEAGKNQLKHVSQAGGQAMSQSVSQSVT